MLLLLQCDTPAWKSGPHGILPQILWSLVRRISRTIKGSVTNFGWRLNPAKGFQLLPKQ